MLVFKMHAWWQKEACSPRENYSIHFKLYTFCIALTFLSTYFSYIYIYIYLHITSHKCIKNYVSKKRNISGACKPITSTLVEVKGYKERYVEGSLMHGVRVFYKKNTWLLVWFVYQWFGLYRNYVSKNYLSLCSFSSIQGVGKGKHKLRDI